MLAGAEAFLRLGWSLRREVWLLTVEHVELAFVGILAGAAVGIPLGILLALKPGRGRWLLDAAGALYTVPSLALLGFLIPVLGIGREPAVVALAVYALLPLLRNTHVGIRAVDPALKEAVLGLGASRGELLLRVELPLALPSIMAGLRTVAVLTVGIATLGALVGAGGLGVLVFQGLSTLDWNLTLLGAIPIALLAVLADQTVGALEGGLWRITGIRS